MEGKKHPQTANHLTWNFAGFACTAMSGFLVNFLVARYSTPAALGVFNQAFAAYIILSQIAVAGVHLSVLKMASEHAGNLGYVGSLLAGAQRLVLPLGFAAAFLMYVCGDLAARLAQSDGLDVAFRMAAPGVLLFAVNKTIISAFNGMSALRLVAVLQALRPAAMIVWITGILMTGGASEWFAGALTFAEAVVLGVALTGLHWLAVPLRPAGALGPFVKAHWSFGVRATPGAVLGELNTRVDVILLGWFLADREVGIYSFAALVAEGLFQLGIVVRTVFNPRFAAYYASGELARLTTLVRRLRNRSYVGYFLLSAVTVVLFPLLVEWLAGEPDYLEGSGAFLVLAVALVLTGGYIPVSQLLVQTGHPQMNSLIVAAAVLVNVCLNLLLIPSFGLVGSALGAGAAWLAQTLLLILYSRHKLRLAI